MTQQTPETYADLAEAGWRWVLDQVRWDDGPWIPVSVPPDIDGVPDDRDEMHSGIGGLAHVLAEIQLAPPWTDEEAKLAEGIATRVRAGLATTTSYSYFEGLVGDLGVLTALETHGADEAIKRLADLAAPDGWPQTMVGPPRCSADARINDATLGTAAVLLGALWARRHGVEAATGVAEHAAAVLMEEVEPTATGTNWRFVPIRFCEAVENNEPREMPNWSHGLAGIAAALAVAGAELDRPDLVAAARSGAEHLVTLGDTSDGGFVVPHFIPSLEDFDEVTFTWCHGPIGTSLLFRALEQACVEDVAGESPDRLAPPLPPERAELRSARSDPAGLLGQRWPVLRHGRCRRRLPRRVAARRDGRRSGLRAPARGRRRRRPRGPGRRTTRHLVGGRRRSGG